jgi:hypothetical protein
MIVVVYHTYLVGQWKNLVKSQLNRLLNSGLYESADQIWVTINRVENTEEEVKEFLKEYSRLNLEFHEQNYAEYPGIKKVKEIATDYDAKILYFHTKGVSNNWKVFNTKEPSQEKMENVASWRECMEYFLIDKWTECNEKLEDYDNVGVSCNGGWYWGNFWWSKSEHLRKTEDVGLWSRWDYEAWLNRSTPNSKNFEFYHMGFNPFLTNLKEDFYKIKNSEFEGKNIVIKNAVYGTPPFEIDEGYSTMPTEVVADVTEVVKKLLEKKENKKLDFNVNNETMGGDPIWGHRKSMIVEFYPEGCPDKIYKIGVTEGHSIEFEF